MSASRSAKKAEFSSLGKAAGKGRCTEDAIGGISLQNGASSRKPANMRGGPDDEKVHVLGRRVVDICGALHRLVKKLVSE
jgi:hypothetical protein